MLEHSFAKLMHLALILNTMAAHRHRLKSYFITFLRDVMFFAIHALHDPRRSKVIRHTKSENTRMNVKGITSALIIAVSALSPALANAQQARAEGLYIYGALGRSDFSDGSSKSDIDNDLRAAGAAGLTSTLEETDTAYKLQAGYMFHRNFGVEGGYVDLGKADYTATFVGGSVRADVGVKGWTLAAIGVVPVSPSFSLFAKFGGIHADVKANVSARVGAAAATVGGSDKGWSPNYGGGLMYSFSPNVSMRVEYERFADMGDANTTGQGDVDLLSVGLKWSFR